MRTAPKNRKITRTALYVTDHVSAHCLEAQAHNKHSKNEGTEQLS